MPFIDLANHSSEIDAEVTYAYFPDGFNVFAGKRFAKGEQAYISYGRQTTDSLLQYYGFIEERNESDVYTFVDAAGTLVDTGNADSVRAQEKEVAAALQRVTLTATAQVRIACLTSPVLCIFLT